MTTVVEVKNRKQKKLFIDFPHVLYKGDLCYVPEIYIAQKELLNPSKNPFFEHSSAQLFLACQNGEVVGRIAAIRNNNHNAYTNSNIGFFGFFDVIENYEVAKALLDKAVEWVKSENLEGVMGPTNFTTNDTCGLLVDGFDDPPAVMMTYNKPYYADYLERFGFKPKMNLLAYLITKDNFSDKSLKLMDRLEERLRNRDIVIRTVDMKNFGEEVRKIKEIYNAAWDKNWGFVPATDKEFEHLAEGLKLVINPEYCIIAEHQGKPIGFVLALPDINRILIKIKKGRLFPFGIFKLLLNKNKVNKIRIVTLGVLEDYRRMGIEGIFYAKIIKAGLKNKVTSAEASWILEDNEMMKKGIENINGRVYKQYRLYEKDFTN